ncbi:MAG TPA: acetyl-coenzyme A synthetase N-terminal domain-containing protein, partial [Longimicrobiales bacterium]|nr:acetyl-coenzyme A synthetase N-terminal domain-containing protein [Longimicrobiales bacterium]
MSELWRPSPARVAGSELSRFARSVGQEAGPDLMARLHAWSVENPRDFWRAVWDFSHVAASSSPTGVVDDPTRMPGATWFPGARLNFAENLLAGGDAEDDALVSWNEHGHVRTLSRGALRDEVARFAAGLRRLGIDRGDRVAG